MKSLYIAESAAAIVKAEAGTLVVQQKGRAPWYVPPGRVERAVLWGNVLVDAGALGLLLRHRVPISFVGRGGEMLGAAWPPGAEDSAAAGLLERKRRSPAWVEEYRKLLASWVREARLELVRKTDLDTWRRWRDFGFRRPQWDVWRSALYPSDLDRRIVDAPWRYLKSLTWEAVTGLALGRGLDPHRGILDYRMRFGLVRELAQPLMPWVDDAVLWGLRAGIVIRSSVEEDGAFRLKPAAVRRWTAKFEGELPWLKRATEERIGELLRLARAGAPAQPPGPPDRQKGVRGGIGV